MPSPRSKGPNMCPMGAVGVIGQLDGPLRWSDSWICSELALRNAMEAGGIDYCDWMEGTYPPDLRSILAYEV